MKVLLTNCTRNGGVIVARALARAGHRVVGADDRRLPCGMRSRYVERQHLVPPEGDTGLADALLDLVRRERPDVLLPFGGAAAVAAKRADFAALTGMLVPNAAGLERVSDKAALPAVCRSFGVDAPGTYSAAEAESAIRRGAALVVKPRHGLAGGGDGVRFVATVDALRGAVASIERRGQDVVIAERIPGGTDQERALHLLFDAGSRLIASFALRKTAQSPPHVGITAAAVSVHAADLVERVVPLFASLAWQGPADVEWKIDPRGGEPKLIEINARFSGAIGFPIALGVDMPGLYVLASRGLRAPGGGAPPYEDGVRYINPGPYLRALPARMRESGLRATVRALREEWSGPRAIPAWQIGDPGPLIGKMLLGLAPRSEGR